MAHRLRELRGRFALLALGCIVGVALFEGGVRMLWNELAPRYGFFEYSPDGQLELSEVFVPNPHIGWTRLPARRFLYRQPEFEVEFVTNNQGFRAETDFDRQSDELLVAFLGDSITEAVQVPQAETFAGLIERGMRGAGKRVRVQNYAVSSFGFPHYLQVYRHFARPRRPDLVVVFVFPPNDVEDSSPQRRGPREVRPSYDLVGNGDIRDVLPFTFEPGPAAPHPAWSGIKGFARRHFAVYRLMLWLRYAPPQRPPRGQRGEQDSVYNVPPSPYFQKAWRHASWAFETLRQETASDGVPLLSVIVPGRETVDDSAWSKVASVTPGADRHAHIRSLSDMVSANGEQGVIDMSPDFEAAYRSGRAMHYTNDGHLTKAGHAVVAERTLPLLARILEARTNGIHPAR